MMPVAEKSKIEQDDNLLEHVDLLIYQKIQKENPLGVTYSDEYILKKVRKNSRKFCMPNLYGIGAWMFPYQTKKTYSYNKESMFYQDTLLEEAFEQVKEKTVQSIISYIESKEPDSEMQKRVFQESFEELERREHHWDIKLSGYIKKFYKDMPMFNDIGHPSRYLMLELVRKACDALGFSADKKNASTVDEEFLKNFIFGLYGVVHKPVIKSLGLRYESDYLEVKKRIRVDNFSGDLNYREVSIIEFIRAYFFVSKGIVLDKRVAISNKIRWIQQEKEKLLKDIVPDRNYLNVSLDNMDAHLLYCNLFGEIKQLGNLMVETNRCMLENDWAQIYHDTIIGSEWLLDKSVSPGGYGRQAVGYNFLYALYRILDEMRPRNILEMGLGQSTKLTGQYARYFGATHTVVEHDREWVEFFCHGWKKLSQQTRIYLSPLKEAEFDGQKYHAYRDFDKIVKELKAPCELILVDAPFGEGSERSRRDIIAYLPQLLSKEFVIMVDDCGRKGEKNLLQEIQDILGRNHIEYSCGLYKSGGGCQVGIVACKKWHFFTSM